MFAIIDTNICISILGAYPRYDPVNSSSSTNQPLPDNKSPLGSLNSLPTNNYPSYFNMIPPVNFSLPPPTTIPLNSISHHKRSVPSNKKRPRLTAQLRHEILQLKANKPTIFVWEIQQTLLQNGICTSQTLPHVNNKIEEFFKKKKNCFDFFSSLGYSYSTNS